MTRDNEQEDRLELERWKAAQPSAATLWDVLETGNPRLIAAFITPVFRRATAEAVEETRRVEKVRAFVLEAFGGDQAKAEQFLRGEHLLLGGGTPLQRAVASEEGADEVIRLVARALDGGGL